MTTTSIESLTDKLVEEVMSLIKRVVGVVLVGFFMESMVKRSQMLKEWRVWTHRIAAVVRNLIPHVEFSVMGSVVRGDSIGGSDVDVLVVSVYVPENLAERTKLKALIEEKLNLPYYRPFEIHSTYGSRALPK